MREARLRLVARLIVAALIVCVVVALVALVALALAGIVRHERARRLPGLPLSGTSSQRIYAHRGASAELPENTLAAFALALQLGASAIETDAQLTADGVVVLCHDADGRRTCGVDQRFERTSLAEVKTWDAGGGSRVPTLEEALLAFPAAEFNVDAKSAHPGMVPALLATIRRAGAEGRVLLASFSGATARRVRGLGYEGKTGLAQGEALRLLALPSWALAREEVRGWAAQIPHSVWGVDLGTRAVIDRFHSLGMEVHYWTVNDPALARWLFEAGADAVMTDDPRRVVAPVG